MRVTMIGAGYVGLFSGTCFADFGHQVTVIDNDTRRVAALQRGEIPIFEPGLSDLVDANPRAGPNLPPTRHASPTLMLCSSRSAPLAPRRRPCRPALRLRCRARDRAVAFRRGGRGD